MLRRLLFFALLLSCLTLAAQLSERHAWQLDLSAQRINSLSPSAAQALDALTEPLEMTAFIPDYPVQRAQIEHLLAPYLAHPSRPGLAFVDPVSEPGRARELGVQRHGELQLRSGQRREVIAAPAAPAIDLALNRLALQGDRWIVSLRGHGEREVDDSPAGLGRLVGQVERLGYRFVSIDPRQVDEIPDNTEILLIAGPQRDYGAHSQALITRFIERGGPVLWLLGERAPPFLADSLGVGVLPGIVVDAAAARHQLDSPDNAIVSDYPPALLPRPPDRHSVLKRARGLTLDERDDWQLLARLQTGAHSWNETDDLQGTLARDPLRGERAGPLDVALALQASGPDGPQRVMLVGSPDFVSNDQIGHGDNLALTVGLLHWLSANIGLEPASPAHDLDIRWSPRLAAVLAVGLMGLLPVLYLGTGLWLRSRRRKA